MEFTSESLENYIEILEEADKAFVGNLAKDFVAQAQADIFFQLGIRDKELMKTGLNLVATSTGAYNKSMLDIVGKFQTGTIDSVTAFRDWRAATKTAMTGMYRGGGMAVGNPFFQDLKIPARDLRLMSNYLNKEGTYFKQLLRDIKNPKHVPVSKIPRDAAGKRLPGYKQQYWDYAQRAGMYPDSLKAMRYNGMVRGAGSNMEIFWVMGVPQTVHCVDCPALTGRMWTGETLPTVPGAGDTKCGWKCFCHLEFRQRVSKTTFDLAGSSTRGALMAPGRQARVIDPRGTEIGGQLQADIEGYMARMYKARQMIEITTGAERMKWIAERKKWNRLAIERAEATGSRVVPTISSSALTKTIKSIQAKGGTLVSDFSALTVGQEVWFVRGDYSSFGLVAMQDGVLVFKSPTGIVLRSVGETDVVFQAQPSWRPSGTLAQAEKWAQNSVTTDTMYHGTSATAIDRIIKGGFSAGTIGAYTGNAGIHGVGYYFAPGEYTALAYTRGDANPMKVKLNIKNPLRSYDEFQTFYHKARETNLEGVALVRETTRLIKEAGYDSVWLEGQIINEICIFDAKNIMVIIE